MSEPPSAEQMQWAMQEASAQAVPVAPGWFRAWPQGDEKWGVVNLVAATQLIVNHSLEDPRHPDAWTVRALFGDKVVEMHGGPYHSKAEAVLVAQAMLSLAFGQH